MNFQLRFKQVIPFILLAAGVLLSPEMNAQIALKPEVRELEKSLEAKLLGSIQTLLGAETRVSVSVHVTESPRIAKTAPKLDGVKPAESDFPEGAYIPFTLPQESKAMGGSGQGSGERELESEGLRIDSVEVDFQATGEMDGATEKSIKDLAGQMLRGLNPRVTLTKIALPPSRSLASKAAEAAKEAAKEKELDRQAALERLEQERKQREAEKLFTFDRNAVLSMAATAFAALILCIGILFMGRALRYVARELSDGVRTLKPSTGSDIRMPEPAKANTSALDRPPALGGSLKDYPRNVRAIKQIIADKPMLFVQALTGEEVEYRGLRWLLPALSDEEQEKIQKVLGKDRLSRLLSTEPQKGAQDREDYTQWLQELVERVMVKKIQGGSPVEQALGPERTLQFYMANPNSLVRAAVEVNSRAGWRIASSFLPKDTLENLMSELDAEKWRILVSSSETGDEEVRSASVQLQEAVQRLSDQSSANEAKIKFLSETLLLPAIGMLIHKPLGEDDVFLDGLESSEPDFAQMIRSRVWTPRTLDRIPQDELLKIVKGLDNSQKTALLLALPEAQAQRIEGALPEGNVRTIVLDQVKKARARKDSGELRAAVAVAREFLDFLRRQEKAGKLHLESAPPNMRQAA